MTNQHIRRRLFVGGPFGGTYRDMYFLRNNIVLSTQDDGKYIYHSYQLRERMLDHSASVFEYYYTGETVEESERNNGN